MKAFVGLPRLVVTRSCGYSADLDQPQCEAAAVVHLAVRDEAWGVISLATCAGHEPIARAAGEVLAEHPFADLCQFPTGECWS